MCKLQTYGANHVQIDLHFDILFSKFSDRECMKELQIFVLLLSIQLLSADNNIDYST